mmetsp:Transcript_29061/g.41106  ORF Transcript_29061/g.41106 Transcript_29061/m.41106 type:complete len:147 (-) Transcript_29061:1055-1495(-)
MEIVPLLTCVHPYNMNQQNDSSRKPNACCAAELVAAMFIDDGTNDGIIFAPLVGAAVGTLVSLQHSSKYKSWKLLQESAALPPPPPTAFAFAFAKNSNCPHDATIPSPACTVLVGTGNKIVPQILHTTAASATGFTQPQYVPTVPW